MVWKRPKSFPKCRSLWAQQAHVSRRLKKFTQFIMSLTQYWSPCVDTKKYSPAKRSPSSPSPPPPPPKEKCTGNNFQCNTSKKIYYPCSRYWYISPLSGPLAVIRISSTCTLSPWTAISPPHPHPHPHPLDISPHPPPCCYKLTERTVHYHNGLCKNLSWTQTHSVWIVRRLVFKSSSRIPHTDELTHKVAVQV